jgi:hypothetical protein
MGMMIRMEATSLRFAAAARSLGSVARSAGLEVPGFRSPPRVSGVERTLRRRPDGAVVISVRIKGRPWVSVLADMIDGVVVTNGLEGPAAGAARTAMWTAVEADVARGSGDETRRRVPVRRADPVPPVAAAVPDVRVA